MNPYIALAGSILALVLSIATLVIALDNHRHNR